LRWNSLKAAIAISSAVSPLKLVIYVNLCLLCYVHYITEYGYCQALFSEITTTN
jgi:hypothetical protein